VNNAISIIVEIFNRFCDSNETHQVRKNTMREHLQQITYTPYPKHTLSLSLSPLPITTFVFLVMVAAANYQNPITKNRVEGKSRSFR